MDRITQQQVKELFDYDAETGYLIRKTRVGNQLPGAVAGCISKGTWEIFVDKKLCPRARLVWTFHNGEYPTGKIIHINGHRLDDRIENLKCGAQLNGKRIKPTHTDGMVSREYLQKLYHYDPATGVWTRARNFGQWTKGAVAGSVTRYGYVYLKIGGHGFMAHRLAWLYMTGQWPSGDIDHINGERADNRWNNLREATRKQNAANSKKRKNHGVKGVHLISGKWVALIHRDGRNERLGSFDTIEEAAAARRVAAEQIDGAFVRHE